ncbi:MAG: hypothetical protein Q8P26_05550 [Candidatus Levybacteria bacterium]|nr:hypothetical protein [Candidatus Levybacteria bacterium]
MEIINNLNQLFKSLIKNRIFKVTVTFIFIILIYSILYKIYSKRVNAFGCFDDCFNIVAGYFMLQGKHLYSEIYFNHQPLAAYISYLIQLFGHPSNIYELILQHRQFLISFNLIMSFILILRFNLIGILFVLIYEFSKFYVLGDRFLPEAILIYPLIYLLGLVLYKFQNKSIYNFDYALSAIFAWFVIFLREPQALFALAAYLLILIGKPIKAKIISLFIFIILSITLFQFINFADYFSNVIILNLNATVKNEVANNNFFGVGFLKSFLYPFYIFIADKWNLFRFLLISLSIVFTASLIIFAKTSKKILAVATIFFLLGLLNLRPVTPGVIFYEAFHILPWYAAFIFATLSLHKEAFLIHKKIGIFLSILFMSFFAYFIFSPSSFINDKVNMQEEFLNNYGNYLQIGEVVNILSSPEDTLFLDGADDLIYWQAKLISSYKYSIYYRNLYLDKYPKAREEMFIKNPPDFYYDFCSKNKEYFSSIPNNNIHDYQQLYSAGKPTCLYVKKSKLPEIKPVQWEKAKEFIFSLPNPEDVQNFTNTKSQLAPQL